MFPVPFNWVDIVIAIILALMVWRGFKDGIVTQVLVNVGVFAGIFGCGWLFSKLPVNNATTLFVINTTAIIMTSIALGTTGFLYGRKIHISLSHGPFRWVESGASVVYSLSFGLVGIWLFGAMIGRMPFIGLSNSVNDAYIVRTLTQLLPPVPAVVAVFDKQFDPNTTPQIFIKDQVQTRVFSGALDSDFQRVLTQSEASIVRVTGFGCGGIVTGSGFVVAPGFVVTNAHVIAGVKHPVVKFADRSEEGMPVLFDPLLDLAVMKIAPTNARPLPLAQATSDNGTSVVLAGYPGGNFTAIQGILNRKLTYDGTSIYGTGTVYRELYELNIALEEGSSGSPILLKSGEVAAIVYARSNNTSHAGYAYIAGNIAEKVNQVQRNPQRVSTRICVKR